MTGEELRRRIEAARILRGISQDDMDVMGHADGLRKQELSRTERGDLPLTRIRRDVLARVLRVPERWLLAETVDEIVAAPPTEADIARRLDALTEAVGRLDGEPGAALERDLSQAADSQAHAEAQAEQRKAT